MSNLLTKGLMIAVLTIGITAGGAVVVQGQEAEGDLSTIEVLQQQVEQLQERVTELRAQIEGQAEVNESVTSAADTINRFTEEMERGDEGDEVRRLQEFLASSEEIYPEGLTTGYYGPLTESAVARLQARLNLPSVGNLNEQTRNRINDLLENGAGNSGVVPQGLLHAPGMQRHLSDDDDNATTTDDEMEDSHHGPDVDNLPISERIKERLRSIFDNFNHGDDEKGEESGELEIEVEIEDGEVKVEIEHKNGDEEEFTFKETNKDEIIARIAEETDLTEEEIQSHIKFETDDDDDEEQELEIEAEIEDGQTEVEVEYADDSEEEFVFETTDESEVITRLAEETDFSEEEIQEVIEFENDDENEDEEDDETENEEE